METKEVETRKVSSLSVEVLSCGGKIGENAATQL